MRLRLPPSGRLFHIFLLLAVFQCGRLVEQSHRMFRWPLSVDDTSLSALQQHYSGQNPPAVLYGHIHVAKTAGSHLNALLAAKFERVCGHKGYSYDSYQQAIRQRNKHNDNQDDDENSKGNTGKTNNKSRNNKQKKLPRDTLASLQYNRGRVPVPIMDEIGYEDCDYVSQENDWTAWANQFAHWPVPVELHVPCRDPADHLMSLCHFAGQTFDCNRANNNPQDLEDQLAACQVEMNNQRFQSRPLAAQFSLQCFAHDQIPAYLARMGRVLQPKRMPTPDALLMIDHQHDATTVTTTQRDKQVECIWKDPSLQQRVRQVLLSTNSYYEFCQQCMGGPNDLLKDITAKTKIL